MSKKNTSIRLPLSGATGPIVDESRNVVGSFFVAAGDPQEGVAAELQYLVRGVGERDDWGVLVSVNEEESYAEVDLDLPLPVRALGQMLAVRRVRIPFTDEDRLAQEWNGCPDSWNNMSAFASQVRGAQHLARKAAVEAAFEHLRGLLATDARASRSMGVIRTALAI